MATDERLSTWLTLLRKGTENRALHWETTPSEAAFRSDLPDGAVRIWKVGDPQSPEVRPVYLLTLLDNEGRTVEEWDSSSSGEEEGLSDLYHTARRAALRLNDRLERMLKALSQAVGEKV